MNGVPGMTERRPGRAGYSPSRGVTVPREDSVAIASGEPLLPMDEDFRRPTALRRDRRATHLPRTIIETGVTSFRLAHFRRQHTAG